MRHTDAWAVFRFDPRGVSATTGSVRLVKQFDTVTLGQPPQTMDLTRDEYQMSAGPEGTLFLLDPVAGRLLKITTGGQATVVRSLVGLPKDLSTPALCRGGQMLLFAANEELIKPQSAADADAAAKLPHFDATFPAMLIFEADGKLSHIGRDDMQAYPGFPVFRIHLRQLVPHPTQEAWISYDAGSGELLRVKIREKSWQ